MQDVISRSSFQLSKGGCLSGLLPTGSTLFCDFDGPIADVSNRYYNTYQLALAATQSDYTAQGLSLPLRRLTKGQFWYMKQNRLPDTTIADWSGLSGSQIEAFLAHVDRLVNCSSLLDQDLLQPGVRSALATLQDRQIRVVIVTLRQASQVLDFLHQYGLATAICQIYGPDSAEIAYANRTQHKIGQLRAAIADQSLLGVDTTHSWMIGDTEADVCAGQAVGLPTLALTCGIRSSIYLKGFAPTGVQRDLENAVRYLTDPIQD